jgi:hypothetical protein
MTDFEKRLEKAIQRGQRASHARAQAEAEQALSEQELRRLHSQYRLELTEHIEEVVKKLTDALPGFRYGAVVSERGWGAAVSRDDFGRAPRSGRSNSFSRLELAVRPLSELYVLELVAKGTVKNREVFNRSHYQQLADVDLAAFRKLIDAWVLEYAEIYTAKS